MMEEGRKGKKRTKKKIEIPRRLEVSAGKRSIGEIEKKGKKKKKKNQKGKRYVQLDAGGSPLQ